MPNSKTGANNSKRDCIGRFFSIKIHIHKCKTSIPFFFVQFHHSALKFPDLLFPLIPPVQFPSCSPISSCCQFWRKFTGCFFFFFHSVIPQLSGGASIISFTVKVTAALLHYIFPLSPPTPPPPLPRPMSRTLIPLPLTSSPLTSL